MRAPIVVVGDVLLDRDVEGRVTRVCPDAPVPVLEEQAVRERAGGAGLAASMVAAEGRPVQLVTALSGDAGGRRLAALLAEAGVEVVDLGFHGPTSEKVRMRSDGQSLMRLDRGGGPGHVGPPTQEAMAVLSGAAAVLVSDYGRGVAGVLRPAVSSARGPVVWDPHPRGPAPASGARLVTPNLAELAGASDEGAVAVTEDLGCVAGAARRLLEAWDVHGVAVTMGGRGAVLVTGEGPPLVVPPPALAQGDPNGAGDRFAATLTAGLADGGLPSEALVAAVDAAARHVAAATGTPAGRPWRASTGSPPPPSATPCSWRDASDVVAAARRSGGTVVATGGCFDLLHAGHVSLLRSARALGDCLVVCLNSDSSVRALKGAPRPCVPERDRAEVLLALGCVDAVHVFDEPTPSAALRRLRPDIFVKGGDYGGTPLPEQAVLAEWGAQAVVVPYLRGRSTTALVERVGQDTARRQ